MHLRTYSMICISIFFNHISSNISWSFSKSLAENLSIIRVFLCLTGLSSEHRIPPSVILFGPSEWFPRTIHEGNMVFSIFIIKFYNFTHIPLTVIYCCNTCICSILPYKLSLTSKFTSCWIIRSLTVSSGADQLPYLDLQLEIDNGRRLITKLYDKLDDSTFPIVNFPCIISNIPA